MAKPLTTTQKGAAGVALAAMLALATPLVGVWEGKSNLPYPDKLAGGLMTVCYGETRVEMRPYSDAECSVMLQRGLADFATPVLKRNPELEDRPNQWAAATSLAYNIGVANYRKSTVAKRFSAGRWREGCNAFLLWNNASGKVVRGLTRRREAERQTCLRGI